MKKKLNMKWDNKEIDTIMKTSAECTRNEILNLVIPYLPNRNLRSVRRKIREIFGTITPKWTEEEKQKIIDVYRQFPARKVGFALKKALPNKTKDAIYQMAFSLGVTNQYWSKEEIDLVESWAGRYKQSSISRMLKTRGFNKTENAVKGLFEKMKWSRKLDVYTCNEVAIGLGCSWKNVLQWINKGYLKSEQKGVNKYHEIKPKDISLFIKTYPYEINNYKPDIPWLVALLDEFKKGENGNGTN